MENYSSDNIDPTSSRLASIEERLKIIEDYLSSAKGTGHECPRCGWSTIKIYEPLQPEDMDSITGKVKWRYHNKCGCGYIGASQTEDEPTAEEKFMTTWKLMNGIKR